MKKTLTLFSLLLASQLLMGCLFDEEKKPPSEWPEISDLEEIQGCWLETWWGDGMPCAKICFSTDSIGYSITYKNGIRAGEMEFNFELFGKVWIHETGVTIWGPAYQKKYSGNIEYDSTFQSASGILYVRNDSLFVKYVSHEYIPPKLQGLRLTPENNCGESWIYFQKPEDWEYYSG